MFTTKEIIDLIRTGFIPNDPLRAADFNLVRDALNTAIMKVTETRKAIGV